MTEKFYIKEYCKICYQNKKYNLLKLENNVKKCESGNCNGFTPFYANAKNREEFVRDFQNSPTNGVSMRVDRCKRSECDGCSFAHNDFEFFIWNKMRTINRTKISQLYKEFIEPYIYIPNTKRISFHQITPITHHQQLPIYKINQVPQSKIENEIIHQEEKRKHYLCWFCLKEISSENGIPLHIDSKLHKTKYEADKKRRWYFKMPSSQVALKSADVNQNGISNQMDDAYLEMCARIKFREFLSSYTYEHSEKKIIPWPKSIKFNMPFFPSNIKCYKFPIQLFAKLSISLKCHKLVIYLRDDESRPFFKLIKTSQNQIIEHRNQLMSICLNDNQPPYIIEFGVEFHPIYCSTYRQRIEFDIVTDKGEYTFSKSIRVDVGSNEHLQQFKSSWERYKNVITQNTGYKTYVPFNISETTCRGIMTEELLESVFKVISNLNWIKTQVEHDNYCNWMRDMMVLEELEQRLILSKLIYEGPITIKNHLMISNSFIPANDGKLFGDVKFQQHHDQAAREIIIKCVSNCYVAFDKFRIFLFECELVDLFRYENESRSVEGVSICFSKQTVETVDLKNLEIAEARIFFTYSRLLFDRRHSSLNRIPIYDKLSYNPLTSPFFTRLPYGEDESTIAFKPKNNLNEEQKRLPKLVLRKIETTEIALPFILNGAFGTGKTLVIAETVMAILEVELKSSILICTRSYSAGELYLQIFQKYIPRFFNKIKLIKFAHKRKATENNIIFSDELTDETFINNCVFITTIENAVDSLSNFLPILEKLSMFNYIFVDEAAQVLEVDAIMVYQFSNYKTKFIFAGDIFQTRPELYNTKLKKFSVPIICRLYNLYKLLKNYTITLTEVYRTHPIIVEYLSRAIYETQLISLMKPTFPILPMKFYDSSSTSFDEIQLFDKDLCSFKNEKEVKMVVDGVIDLTKNPYIKVDPSKILVCSPFYAQVKLIRERLRSNKLGKVIVEQPSNIQGCEYDVVFISTVLSNDDDSGIPILHPTFHSNRNLINLVISRAKHFVAVIGDKMSLTTDNPTRAQWLTFIEMCNSLPYSE